jgi:hypothetical protein
MHAAQSRTIELGGSKMKLRTALCIGFAALVLVGCKPEAKAETKAEPVFYYKQVFQYMMDFAKNGGQEYFECDYTSHTCRSGYKYDYRSNSEAFIWWVFTVLSDADRKTVVGHQVCKREIVTKPNGRGWFPDPWDTCWDLDNGTWKSTVRGYANNQGEMKNPDCYTNPEFYEYRTCEQSKQLKWYPGQLLGGYDYQISRTSRNQ